MSQPANRLSFMDSRAGLNRWAGVQADAHGVSQLTSPKAHLPQSDLDPKYLTRHDITRLTGCVWCSRIHTRFFLMPQTITATTLQEIIFIS